MTTLRSHRSPGRAQAVPGAGSPPFTGKAEHIVRRGASQTAQRIETDRPLALAGALFGYHSASVVAWCGSVELDVEVLAIDTDTMEPVQGATIAVLDGPGVRWKARSRPSSCPSLSLHGWSRGSPNCGRIPGDEPGSPIAFSPQVRTVCSTTRATFTPAATGSWHWRRAAGRCCFPWTGRGLRATDTINDLGWLRVAGGTIFALGIC